MTKVPGKFNIMPRVKGNEKEEYIGTVLREDGSSAERLSEYDRWKVAFEPEDPESLQTESHKESQNGISFPGTPRYGEEICIDTMHNEGGTALIRPSYPVG